MYVRLRPHEVITAAELASKNGHVRRQVVLQKQSEEAAAASAAADARATALQVTHPAQLCCLFCIVTQKPRPCSLSASSRSLPHEV